MLGNHVYFLHVKVLWSLGLQQCLETRKGEEQVDQELRPCLLPSLVTGINQKYKSPLLAICWINTCQNCNFTFVFKNKFYRVFSAVLALQGVFKANLNWTDQSAIKRKLHLRS